MSVVLEILNIVLPVFLVIGVGYVLAAAGFLKGTINNTLSRLVFYVAAPALLFRSASLTPLYRAINLKSLGWIAGVTLLVVCAVYLACARSHPARRGVLAQGAHRSNMVFMGLPVIVNAYGEGVLGPAAVLIGFMVVVYNFLSVLVLILPHQKGNPGARGVFARTALEVARNPLILGSGLGILFSALTIRLPVFADRSLELIGRIALPLALITVGAGLDFRKLKAEWSATAVVSLIKLVVYPGLVYLGLVYLGFTGVDLRYPVLVMASPTAVVSYIMAREMKGDETLAGSIVIGTTVASLFTISAWLAFFRFTG